MADDTKVETIEWARKMFAELNDEEKCSKKRAEMLENSCLENGGGVYQKHCETRHDARPKIGPQQKTRHSRWMEQNIQNEMLDVPLIHLRLNKERRFEVHFT